LDGSLEKFSPDELQILLEQSISADNLCSSNHEGLMQRLAVAGLVFRLDQSSCLEEECLPQVDMI
jgi:hypothetical protein